MSTFNCKYYTYVLDKVKSHTTFYDVNRKTRERIEGGRRRAHPLYSDAVSGRDTGHRRSSDNIIFKEVLKIIKIGDFWVGNGRLGGRRFRGFCFLRRRDEARFPGAVTLKDHAGVYAERNCKAEEKESHVF